MAMSSSSPFLSPSSLSLKLIPRTVYLSSSSSPLRHLPLSSSKGFHNLNPSHERLRLLVPAISEKWKLYPVRHENFWISEAEVPQEIVSTSVDDGGSVFISALFFAAFVGLSILTIGVIYLGVTDFLQKREREKFEKEEAANKKKSGKKTKVRARARSGPRGFGQKIEDDENDEAD